jgi:hypothetical protein
MVTVGCILSLYATGGCEVIQIDVGFTPDNVGWNHSKAVLGFFFYSLPTAVPQHVSVTDSRLSLLYPSEWYETCQPYTTKFDEVFIDRDRTWVVARVMAALAATTSLLATFLAWSFVTCPVSLSLWPTLLLPVIMLAFIAESSKFLLLDVALCQDPWWYPAGSDSLPQKADSCTLGPTAYVGIAAAVVLLLSLLFVCWVSPEYRDLDPEYGITEADEEAPAKEASLLAAALAAAQRPSATSIQDDDDDEEGDGDFFPVGGPTTARLLQDSAPPTAYSPWGLVRDTRPDPGEDRTHDDAFYSKARPTLPDSSKGPAANRRISESRLSQVARAERNVLLSSDGSFDQIERLVSDLNSTFYEYDEEVSSSPINMSDTMRHNTSLGWSLGLDVTIPEELEGAGSSSSNESRNPPSEQQFVRSAASMELTEPNNSFGDFVMGSDGSFSPERVLADVRR